MSGLRQFELREVAVNTPAVTLGEDIRNARQRLQMTQGELAQLVGVNESTVSNWERDKFSPKNRLALVRQVLKMDPPPADQQATIANLLQDVRDVAEQLARLSRALDGITAEMDRTLTRGGDHLDHGQFKRGHHAPMPTHLINPQADERRESDG